MSPHKVGTFGEKCMQIKVLQSLATSSTASFYACGIPNPGTITSNHGTFDVAEPLGAVLRSHQEAQYRDGTIRRLVMAQLGKLNKINRLWVANTAECDQVAPCES